MLDMKRIRIKEEEVSAFGPTSMYEHTFVCAYNMQAYVFYHNIYIAFNTFDFLWHFVIIGIDFSSFDRNVFSNQNAVYSLIQVYFFIVMSHKHIFITYNSMFLFA